MGEKYLLTIAHEMANRVEAAIPLAVDELRPNLTSTEKVLAGRLLQRILSITQKMRHRILPPAAAGVDEV